MAEELYKQPSESRLYHFVFSNLLGNSETIVGIQSITQTSYNNINGSQALTLLGQAYSNNEVQVRISGGTNLESYRLAALALTNQSNILEVDGILHVRDL